MLTPDYLLHVSEGAEAISARLHTDIVKRITRRIAARQNRGDEYLMTSADKWHIETLMDAGYLRDDIAADIAAATGRQLNEIKEAFEDAGVRSTAYDDKVYKAAGLEPLPFKQSPYMQRLMQRNYDATAGLWQNYTRTTANAAQQTFIDAMDDIYTKVASGAMGYTQAYEEAINDLAANGVDLTTENGQMYVQYRHSRDTIETATLRCVRTGVSQMSAQVTEARMDEFGVDLVIVSSHMGARPEHAVWQGKIYSRSGTDKKYPNFVENTHYGSGDGLCGWNCRHQFSPYFEGMDNPFENIDEKENEEVYDLTQKQRRAEREIRKTRRQAEVLTDYAQQLEDPEEKKRYYESADRVKKLLSKQIEWYNNFCEKNNLRTLPERLKIARASRATGNTNLTKIDVKTQPVTQPVKQAEPPKTVQQAEKTFEQKIAEIRERVRQKGMADDADLHEAGRLVKAERYRILEADEAQTEKYREEYRQIVDELAEDNLRIAEIQERMNEIVNERMGGEFDPYSMLMDFQDDEYDRLSAELDRIVNSERYKTLEDRKFELHKKIVQRKPVTQKADDLRSVLSQVREMGHPEAKKGVASMRTREGKVLASALECYPRDWVQYAIDSGGIRTKLVKRGYCDTFDNLIALSHYTDDQEFGTAIHELGHYFDGKVSISGKYEPYKASEYWADYIRRQYPQGGSFILDAERAFYARRTAGEELKWLGAGYKRTEKSRKDKFIHTYMGKDYGGRAFELVSMGFQYAYTKPETLAKDPDMEEWIYGILALF